MKNHVYENGRLLQTNKKFSALKQKQKEWITNELRQRYISAINYPYIKLRSKKRDQILDEVYDLIQKKEIWIPFCLIPRCVAYVNEVRNYKFNESKIDIL